MAHRALDDCDHARPAYWHWAMVVRAVGKVPKRVGADRENDKSSPLMNADDTDLNWGSKTLSPQIAQMSADQADWRRNSGNVLMA
ncbi:MAG: hypothetical protein ACJ71U_14385 [Terriglobales bacterium]